MTKEELTKNRESLSLTKKELAEKLGITAMLLGRYESGSCVIPSSIAERVNALISEEASSDDENEESLSDNEVQAVDKAVQSELVEEKTFSFPSSDEREKESSTAEEESTLVEEESTLVEEDSSPVDAPIAYISILRKNHTLAELGDLLGVSRTSVANYESAKRIPGRKILEKIKELAAKEQATSTAVATVDEKEEAVPDVAEEKEAVPMVSEEKEAGVVAEEKSKDETVPMAGVADLIKSLRKTYTLSALGKLLGVSGTAVSNYESGKSQPREKIIKKIEELVEMTKNDDATPVYEEKTAPVGEEKTTPVDEEKNTPVDEEKTAPSDVEKNPASPKKVEIYIQSMMGGSITAEEILSRLPDGVEAVYIKPEENAAYWVRGVESGSIYLW